MTCSPAVSGAHEDLEIALPAARFHEMAVRLHDCRLFVPDGGQLHYLGDRPGLLEHSHQTWVEHAGRWRLDVMREPSDVGPGGQDRWVCRRDANLRLPYAEVIRRDQTGVPYLRPDLVMLFKAKAVRPRDQDDFDRTVPDLSADERTHLAVWVARVHGLEHPGWRRCRAEHAPDLSLCQLFSAHAIPEAGSARACQLAGGEFLVARH